MTQWTEFSDNGEFFQVCSSTSGPAPSMDNYAIGSFDDSYYFKDGVVLKKPRMGVDRQQKTISHIPKGATLKLGDQEFIIDDGEADISGYSGTVKITCWPYLDAEVEI